MSEQDKAGEDKMGDMISMRLSPREMKVARQLADSNKTSLSGAVRKAILELAGEGAPVATATLGTVNSALTGTIPTSPTTTSRITMPAQNVQPSQTVSSVQKS